MWVFRLSLDSAGEPHSDMCFVNTDMDYIKDRVKELKEASKSPDDVETKDVTIELLTKDFIEKGKLRQGWGMSYNDTNVDLNLKLDDWIANFVYLYSKLWDEKIDCSTACGRYNILKLMTDMERGDIIFVPRIPDYNSFTVATVKKGYSFDPIMDTLDDAEKTPYGRHGHIVNVDKNTIKSFKYSDTFKAKTFNPYQRAVNEVKEGHLNYEFLKGFSDTQYQ
jgi:hypothetical protein